MSKHFAVICYILALFCSHSTQAQPVNLGLPPVTYYAKTVYQAGTQSWDSKQDERGIIFLANNEYIFTSH